MKSLALPSFFFACLASMLYLLTTGNRFFIPGELDGLDFGIFSFAFMASLLNWIENLPQSKIAVNVTQVTPDELTLNDVELK